MAFKDESQRLFCGDKARSVHVGVRWNPGPRPGLIQGARQGRQGETTAVYDFTMQSGRYEGGLVDGKSGPR